MKLRTLTCLISLASLTLAACTGFQSSNQKASTILPTGRDIVFPDLKNINIKIGTFVGSDNIGRITPGLAKDQVRRELGHPHFSEGLFAVREWDYAFNFYTGKPNKDFVTCQYKVLFNKNNLVESTHWKEKPCEAYVNANVKPIVVQQIIERAPPAPAPAAPASADKPQSIEDTITLGADGLFEYKKSSLDDLLPVGRASIDNFVQKAQTNFKKISMVTITGYTDRIGSADYNLKLSQARAYTIRQYLISKGFNPAQVRAIGMGKGGALKDCPGTEKTEALKACLQPNRRVDIEIVGLK